jgi:hypothetical protein
MTNIFYSIKRINGLPRDVLKHGMLYSCRMYHSREELVNGDIEL